MKCEERERLLELLRRATVDLVEADADRKVAHGVAWAAANDRVVKAEKELSAKRAELFTHESQHRGCK